MLKTQLNVNDLISCLSEIGLTEKEIDLLGFEKGFSKRQGGKINAAAFISLLLSESVNGAASYNDLAAKMDNEFNISVSRQAVAKKINDSCLALIKAVLEFVMGAKLPQEHKMVRQVCTKSMYKRVIVQDSTIVKLPMRLFDTYSGVSNAHTRVCNARIQVAYDLISGEFTLFSIDSYSKNDLKSAPELELQKDDLVLRDRGYLTLDEVKRHLSKGADCIYRHKHKTTYLDPETGTAIDLLKLLKQKGMVDMEVLLNNKTKVRLLAQPVDEKTAQMRKIRLKKESKGHAPSKDLLSLMGWTIFITTIPASLASFENILSMYALRWRIETIFKSWKSNMNFAEIHNVSDCQLKIMLLARFTTIVMINRFVHIPARLLIQKYYGKELSLIKVTKYITNNLNRITETVKNLLNFKGSKRIIRKLARYCCYDKRERQNFPEKLDTAFDWAPLG